MNEIIDFELNCPYCNKYVELSSIAAGEETTKEGSLTITRSFWICPNCQKKIYPRLSDIRR